MNRIIPASLSVLVFLGISCSTSRVQKEVISSSDVLTEPVQNVRGPKRVIAVGTFTSLGSMDDAYGAWEIGGGLSAMLTTALLESGQFIVLERSRLDQLLQEQQMAGEGVVSEGTAPQIGQLIGAQILVFGAVTEFGDDFSGGGVSGSAAGVPAGSNIDGGSAAVESSRGKVGMDIRIVDTSTGTVLSSFRVEEPVVKKTADLSASAAGYSIGGNAFMRTPIGDASRRAITRVVQKLALAADKAPWIGRVVDVEGFEMYINAGAKSGIRYGDRFSIERVVKQFRDPVTGRLLSQRKQELGVLEINTVEAEIAYGTYQAFSAEQPKRGDLVVLID